MSTDAEKDVVRLPMPTWADVTAALKSPTLVITMIALALLYVQVTTYTQELRRQSELLGQHMMSTDRIEWILRAMCENSASTELETAKCHRALPVDH